MRVSVIRTFQPHWSAHSGINQFLSRLPAEGVEVEQLVVDRRVSNRIFRRLESRTRSWFCWRASHIYGPFDLAVEMQVLWRIIFSKTDHVHFLDGEHSLQFLPYLRNCLWGRARAVTISAMFHQPVEILTKMVNPKTASLLDKVIVLSPCQKEFFARFMSPDNIFEIHHGVDCDYFSPAKDQPERREMFICLSVGYWQRDYQFLARVAKLLEKREDIEFHVVSKQAEHLGHLPNVKVYWDIDDAELLRMYQRASLCFLPLKDATANNVLLEAMACGVPLMTTDLPGTRAYFDKSFCYFMAGADDEAAAGQAIQSLADNPEEVISRGVLARERSLANSWENFARNFKEVIV